MSFDVALLETLVGGPVNILILIGSAFFSIFWIGCVIFFFHWLLNKRKFDLVPLRAGQKSSTPMDSSEEKEKDDSNLLNLHDEEEDSTMDYSWMK